MDSREGSNLPVLSTRTSDATSGSYGESSPDFLTPSKLWASDHADGRVNGRGNLEEEGKENEQTFREGPHKWRLLSLSVLYHSDLGVFYMLGNRAQRVTGVHHLFVLISLFMWSAGLLALEIYYKARPEELCTQWETSATCNKVLGCRFDGFCTTLCNAKWKDCSAKYKAGIIFSTAAITFIIKTGMFILFKAFKVARMKGCEFYPAASFCLIPGYAITLSFLTVGVELFIIYGRRDVREINIDGQGYTLGGIVAQAAIVHLITQVAWAFLWTFLFLKLPDSVVCRQMAPWSTLRTEEHTVAADRIYQSFHIL